MESLSLEEKIASFKKKIDDLDQSAPTPAAGDGGPADALYEAPEFEKGKIAAMKNRLVRKGLSVDSGGDSVTAEEDEPEEDGVARDASETDKAARLASEFEKGKIAAMKNRLVEKGLSVEDLEGERRHDTGSNGAGGSTPADSAQGPASAGSIGDEPVVQERQEHSNGVAADGDEPTKSPSTAVVEESEVQQVSPPRVPADDQERPEDSPPKPPADEPSSSTTVDPKQVAIEVSEGGVTDALPSTDVETRDAPVSAVVPDVAVHVSTGNGSAPSAAVNLEATPVRRPSGSATMELSKVPTSAAVVSPSAEGSNVASKAKAVLAASKSRTRPASPGASKRQQRRRASTPDRRVPPVTAERPGSAGRSASPAPNQKPQRGRRLPSPSRRRPQSEAHLAKGRVSPAVGVVSRAVPVTPVTPGLHASSVATAPPAQRRRASSPMKHRASPLSQQQQVATPVRAAAPSSPPMVMTPASAEQVGNRLHEQAREARERMERRRKEGASPLSAVSALSPFSPAVVLTPASAEKSGKRLHEQAQEARERLERRRKEVVSPAATVEGLSPFTPRRWSNPRMGNPSVAGMERVENLYRDAVQRSSKLEIARRTQEESPPDCTFTPEITKRASSRGRGEKRLERTASGDATAAGDGAMSTFHALYLDAKRRRAKMEALAGAHMKEAAGTGSPSITARGRQASVEPLDVRLKENAERWTRRWQELEDRRLEKEREGCTFMPNFSIGRSASAPRLRPRRETSSSSGGIKSFVARNLRFQAAREKKMEKLKKEALQKERAEATFQPKITPRDGENAEGAASGSNVFERLLQAASEQEVNKAALKEEFLRKEREMFHDFQPRLPTRQAEAPGVPLDARIKKSTEEWVKSREVREQRRRELEAQECTFRPSVGTGRRSSSAEPRTRARVAPQGASMGSAPQPVDPEAFPNRAAAFQEAKEERLERLRKEKEKLELREATFQPIIGVAGVSHPGNRSTGADEGVNAAAAAAWAGGAGDDSHTTCRPQSAVVETGDMGIAQSKAVPSAADKKESVGFKPQGDRRSPAVKSGESSATGSGKPFLERNDDDVAFRRGREVDLNRERVRMETEECTRASAAKSMPQPREVAAPDPAVRVSLPADEGGALGVECRDEVDVVVPVGQAEEAVFGDVSERAIEQGVDVDELSARLHELAAASRHEEEEADDTVGSSANCFDSDVTPVASAKLEAEELEESEKDGEVPVASTELLREREQEEDGDDKVKVEPKVKLGVAVTMAKTANVEEASAVENILKVEESHTASLGEGPAGIDSAAVHDAGGGASHAVIVSDNSEGLSESSEGVKATMSEQAVMLSSGADDSAAEEEFAHIQSWREQEEEEEDAAVAEVETAISERVGAEDEEGGGQTGKDCFGDAERSDEGVKADDREESGEEELQHGDTEEWGDDEATGGDGREEEEEEEGALESYGGERGVEQDEEVELGQYSEEREGNVVVEADDRDEEEEPELDDADEDEEEDEEGAFSFTNSGYGSAEASVQPTSRSLADFDRAQREIEAKLRAL